MSQMKKITVEVDTDTLAWAQKFTGQGIAETVRTALKLLQHKQACKSLLALRGKVKFSMTADEIKADRE